MLLILVWSYTSFLKENFLGNQAILGNCKLTLHRTLQTSLFWPASKLTQTFNANKATDLWRDSEFCSFLSEELLFSI